MPARRPAAGRRRGRRVEDLTLTARPRTHYLNADFDLRLRPRPLQADRPAMVRQVRELTAQALIGAGPGDAVLLRTDVPRAYLDYLASLGVEPRVLQHPDVDPANAFRPFGWTGDAIALNRRHRAPTEHPAEAALRAVNARSFATDLEARLPLASRPGRVVGSVAELESWLAASPDGEWLMKAEHGHASLSNRRLRRSRLEPVDRHFVEERLAEDDRLLVEPWLDRTADGSVVFDVPFDRAAVRLHETVYTRDGAPIGAIFGPGPSVLEPWRSELVAAAERIAARLGGAGYCGPVCVDAFTWRDETGQDRLRALADLNCRQAMSGCAYRFWRRHAADAWLYYRFYNRRKFTLPDGVADLVKLFAGLDDDVRLASPPTLVLDGERVRPGKLGVMFVGAGRDAVLAADRRFRERFEGPR